MMMVWVIVWTSICNINSEIVSLPSRDKARSSRFFFLMEVRHFCYSLWNCLLLKKNFSCLPFSNFV